MPLDLDDTIAAIASVPGGAARGIVRVSGPAAVECLARVFTASDAKDLPRSGPTRIFAGMIGLPTLTRSVSEGEAAALADASGWCEYDIPARLYLWPTGRSYTCQPMGELHTLGSPPLLDAVLAAPDRAAHGWPGRESSPCERFWRDGSI